MDNKIQVGHTVKFDPEFGYLETLGPGKVVFIHKDEIIVLFVDDTPPKQEWLEICSAIELKIV